MDERGQLFWINGPDHHCYLSEQRQWRSGLSFDEVLEWKQCAPSGKVSQRFASPQAACEAFEHNLVQWTLDLYLRHMGDEMTLQRGADDYKPTAMKEEEARGGPRRVQRPGLRSTGRSRRRPGRAPYPRRLQRQGCASASCGHSGVQCR